jgi:type IV secretory pathway VirB10-like protein
MTVPTQTPGTVPPVTDRRVPPRGVIPRHMQTWLMAGLAIGILGIILFTGHTDRPQRSTPSAGVQPVAPDAGRLRDYQERLRLLDERARQQATDPSHEEDEPVRPKQDAAPSQTDPIAADKKRRDYESLFAGVLVLSKRPQDQRLAELGKAQFAGSASGGSESAASLNELAALLRGAGEPGSLSTSGAEPPTPSPPRADRSSPMKTPVSGPRLRQGAFIPVSLVNQVDSRSPGPVVCQVIEPVLTEDAQHVLIPAGARLLGESKPVQGQDAVGVPVAFHTLQIGRHDYSLEQFVGLDGLGEPGFDGKVDHHYWSTFGAASMIGLLTGLSQAVATTGVSRGDGDRTIVIAGSTGEAAAEATAQTLDRLLRRPPHISVGPGQRFHVYVSRDLSLPIHASDAMPIATATSPTR